MSTSVSPGAVIHSGAYLADDVAVGPFTIIEDDVHIGTGTEIAGQVTISKGTRIGRNCRISPGAILGGPPQDHKHKGEKSLLIIGDNNILRECVTLHRAVGEGVATHIGNDNMLMTYAHVGHNCEIGDGNTISSYVGLSGHVTIEDNTVIGGMVGIHQFCRIGKLAMVGGWSKVNQDVPPYMLADGVPARVLELNKIGLRRYGVPPNGRTTLRAAYKLIYRSGLNLSQAMTRIEEELDPTEELDYLMAFIQGTQSGYGGRSNDKPRR